MNFLLKIVEGPNRGAEIALVEGVAITLGKGDDCDVILADATMPDAPLSIAVSDDKVLVGGEELPPFNVRTFGSTSFAVGPSDSPWRDLVWPKKEEAKVEPAEEPAGDDIPPVEPESAPEEPKEEPAAAEPPKKSRGVGCLIVLVVLLLLLGAAGWFFRAPLLDFCNKVIGNRQPAAAESEETSSLSSLEAIAGRYGLVLSEEDGIERLSGNLSTRALRLRATAEAYAAKPGILVDLSDDQSFRVSAEDALFTLTEGALKVVSATNRVLAISGSVRSADSLKKVLVALASDMPKLRDVDVSAVVFSGSAPLIRIADGEGDEASPSPVRTVPGLAKAAKDRKAAASSPLLPVCGILTMPYPCLVMRDGSRVMEGASLGGNVIMKIEADAITVTNAVGRFTWKP